GPEDDTLKGAVWVFYKSGGIWTQQGQKLTGLGYIGQPLQGISVSISSDGNTLVEGGYGDNNSVGAVWVFTRTSGIWTQQGSKIIGDNSISWNSHQGYAVSISGDGNTFIEAGNNDSNYVGAIWVFTRTGNVWTQQGSKLLGTGATNSSQQGWSLAISTDGSTFIEGGLSDNNGIGACWVFYNPTI